MAEETTPKKRGRPKKDPNAPKARYNLSRAERARRALQARVRKAEKAKEKHQKKGKTPEESAGQSQLRT